MEEQKFLKPLKGLIVRDPRALTPLAEVGEWKPWIGPEGRYWRRRVKDGSAIISSPEKPKQEYKSFSKKSEDMEEKLND